MRAIGTTDAVTTCDCCGRTNLKQTVQMVGDDGATVHYGLICAAKNSGKTPTMIVDEIEAGNLQRLRDAKKEAATNPDILAYANKVASRPKRLIGKAAAEYVNAERIKSDAALNAIAARWNVSRWAI